MERKQLLERAVTWSLGTSNGGGEPVLSFRMDTGAILHVILAPGMKEEIANALLEQKPSASQH